MRARGEVTGRRLARPGARWRGDDATPADADGAASRGLEGHGVARFLERQRRRSCRFGGRSLAGSTDKTKRIKRTGTVVAYAVLCDLVGG
jgi:hypothetical protein